jgi:hypothetical protein
MPKRHHHRGPEIRKNEPEIYIKMDIHRDAIGEESRRDVRAMQLVAATAYTKE